MLTLGVVLLLPRTSMTQQLNGLADLLCRSLEPCGFGKALVLVSCAQSVDIALEGGVLVHRAERDQGITKGMLVKVVRWPVVFLGFKTPSNRVGKVAVVPFCAAHVA